jgi:fumarate hydratase class I
VKNSVFDRSNTRTNTPCVIYTEIADIDGLEIELLVKGGGSENVSDYKMLSPTASEDDIADYVVSVIKNAGAKGCPPYFIGVGIGGTMDWAAILSKKALLLGKNQDEQHENLAQKIQSAINSLNIGAAGLGGTSTCLDVKILTDFTHIASMPVAVTVNCHSNRHAKAVLSEQFVSHSSENRNCVSNFEAGDIEAKRDAFVKVDATDVEKLKTLKVGQNILLSGEIYTARDMAHKRLVEMLERGEKLPLDLKDKIIFYAGPCPSKAGEVVGSVGPTTSARMDRFAPILYNEGVLATIGKGERSEDVKKSIKENGALYFTAIGGIACYMSQKFVKKELIAFEDLGAEAIYKFEVEELPLRLNFN